MARAERAAAGPGAADELEVGEVARGQDVVAALAVQREDGDRPRADAGDPAQPRPAAPRSRARSRSQRPEATSRATLTSASARPADSRRPAAAPAPRPPSVPRARQVAQRPRPVPRRRPAPQPPHDRALDLRGAHVLDQLLADRPRQRLERLDPAHRPQVRARPHRRPDQRVVAEAVVERPQRRRRRRTRPASARSPPRRRRPPRPARRSRPDRPPAARPAPRPARPRRAPAAPARRRAVAATPSIPRAPGKAERPRRLDSRRTSIIERRKGTRLAAVAWHRDAALCAGWAAMVDERRRRVSPGSAGGCPPGTTATPGLRPAPSSLAAPAHCFSARRRRTTATVAAPAAKPVTATAAAWTATGAATTRLRPHAGAARAPAPRGAWPLGHRQRVDHLDLVVVGGRGVLEGGIASRRQGCRIDRRDATSADDRRARAGRQVAPEAAVVRAAAGPRAVLAGQGAVAGRGPIEVPKT